MWGAYELIRVCGSVPEAYSAVHPLPSAARCRPALTGLAGCVAGLAGCIVGLAGCVAGLAGCIITLAGRIAGLAGSIITLAGRIAGLTGRIAFRSVVVTTLRLGSLADDLAVIRTGVGLLGDARNRLAVGVTHAFDCVVGDITVVNIVLAAIGLGGSADGGAMLRAGFGGPGDAGNRVTVGVADTLDCVIDDVRVSRRRDDGVWSALTSRGCSERILALTVDGRDRDDGRRRIDGGPIGCCLEESGAGGNKAADPQTGDCDSGDGEATTRTKAGRTCGNSRWKDFEHCRYCGSFANLLCRESRRSQGCNHRIRVVIFAGHNADIVLGPSGVTEPSASLLSPRCTSTRTWPSRRPMIAATSVTLSSASTLSSTASA